MILGGAANAAILSTGLGFAPTSGECNVANIGTKPVTVKSVPGIDVNNVAKTVFFTNCTFTGPISPGLACVTIVNIPGGVHFDHLVRCVIDTSSKSSIRATMTYYDSTGNSVAAILEAH
jgi:hypothetical protein